MSIAAGLERRLAQIGSFLRGNYRSSRLRNVILSIRARSRNKRFDVNNRRFIIFLTPGWDLVNGGIISTFSIASETQKLLERTGVTVAICTAYSAPRILRYTKFENDFDVFAFSDLLPRFPSGAEVLVHLPEFAVQRFATDCLFVYRARADLNWRFNILLQNIDHLPKGEIVKELAAIGPVTATTAHKAYATDETARRLGCPVHFLSTWLAPEKYDRTKYSNKKKLVMISPDSHPDKTRIVLKIAKCLPDHRIVEIRDIPYKRYREIAKEAKFAFTFGEGLDNYFIETIFFGGIAMAIFNRRFFTDEYCNLDGVFSDAESALAHVHDFIRAADNGVSYQNIANRQLDLVARSYVYAEYLRNIKEFYEKYFSSA
jgi:hypothetical protein